MNGTVNFDAKKKTTLLETKLRMKVLFFVLFKNLVIRSISERDSQFLITVIFCHICFVTFHQDILVKYQLYGFLHKRRLNKNEIEFGLSEFTKTDN